MMAWFITCLVLSFVVRGSAILGNSAFEAVRNVSAAFSERHDELFQKFSNCSVKRVAPQKVYLTQDGSGGGGIGNLILKINAGVSYAITNGLEYLMPPMLPYGHDESELYKDFFDHSAHDVALRAASVVQLQCVRKFKNLKRLQKQFPNNTLPWWELGGAEDFENATWGGPKNKRCFPSEVLANCGELRPPHMALGNMGNKTREVFSTALVVRLPGSLFYHSDFSVSAPFFRRAYAQRQALIFRVAWAPLIAEFDAVRKSDLCSVENGKSFAVIGLHIRLGDVAAKFSEEERSKKVRQPPHGNWGGKYVSTQMHLSGLDLVWQFIDPACTKIIIVSDGDLFSPEIDYFFEQAPKLDGWGNLTYSEECLHLKNGHVPPGCDVLFFDKTAVSSLESLNLLAYSDVIIASGSQFSRVASMVGETLLLNPNYGFEEGAQVTIPQRRPKGNKTLPQKPQKLLQRAEKRFHHLWRQRVRRQHRREADMLFKSEVGRLEQTAESNVSEHQQLQDTLMKEEAALAQQAEKLKEENAQILKKIKQERKRRQRVQNELKAIHNATDAV